MSWRIVVISSNAKLDYQLGFLVVRKDTITKIYLNEISVLMLEVLVRKWGDRQLNQMSNSPLILTSRFV